MKITHNGNNRWQDEAKMMGLDEQLYPWIEAIIKDEKEKCYKANEKQEKVMYELGKKHMQETMQQALIVQLEYLKNQSK